MYYYFYAVTLRVVVGKFNSSLPNRRSLSQEFRNPTKHRKDFISLLEIPPSAKNLKQSHSSLKFISIV